MRFAIQTRIPALSSCFLCPSLLNNASASQRVPCGLRTPGKEINNKTRDRSYAQHIQPTTTYTRPELSSVRWLHIVDGTACTYAAPENTKTTMEKKRNNNISIVHFCKLLSSLATTAAIFIIRVSTSSDHHPIIRRGHSNWAAANPWNAKRGEECSANNRSRADDNNTRRDLLRWRRRNAVQMLSWMDDGITTGWEGKFRNQLETAPKLI